MKKVKYFNTAMLLHDRIPSLFTAIHRIYGNAIVETNCYKTFESVTSTRNKTESGRESTEA